MERVQCGRRHKSVSGLSFRRLADGKFPLGNVGYQEHQPGAPAGIRQIGNSPYIFGFIGPFFGLAAGLPLNRSLWLPLLANDNQSPWRFHG
jgi:hypothetical protein